MTENNLTWQVVGHLKIKRGNKGGQIIRERLTAIDIREIVFTAEYAAATHRQHIDTSHACLTGNGNHIGLTLHRIDGLPRLYFAQHRELIPIKDCFFKIQRFSSTFHLFN